MLNKINFRHLYYFWMISKEGSIKKAALKLYITQSTLSDQLKRLEQDLGHRLFNRQGRKLVLNSDGKTVFEYLDRFFPEGEKLFESIINKKKENVQVIQVGIIPTISYNMAYKILSPIINSDVFSIKVIQAGFSYLLEEVEKNSLDLIICDNRSSYLGKSLVQHKVMDRTFCAVCSPDFNLPEISFPACLNGQKYIGYASQAELHSQIEYFFYKKDIKPLLIGELDDIDMMRLATIDGYCFSILPTVAIKKDLLENRLRKIGLMDEIACSVFAIIQHEDQKKARQILNIIKKDLNRFD